MTQEILNIQGSTESGKKWSSLEYYHIRPLLQESPKKSLRSPIITFGSTTQIWGLRWKAWGILNDNLGVSDVMAVGVSDQMAVGVSDQMAVEVSDQMAVS